MPKSHVFKTKLVLSPVYTALNFWYGTDKIGTRTATYIGTRTVLVPVPLFWFLDYLFRWSRNQRGGAVPGVERSVNGALFSVQIFQNLHFTYLEILWVCANRALPQL